MMLRASVPCATDLVNRNRQGDYDTEAATLTIAQRNLTAVIHDDGADRSQAEADTARVAVARSFQSEEWLKHLLLELLGNPGSVIVNLEEAMVFVGAELQARPL